MSEEKFDTFFCFCSMLSSGVQLGARMALSQAATSWAFFSESLMSKAPL
jgi:hypothetical protein